MTINLYIDLLNGLLVRSGYAKADYASANHHYLACNSIAQACDAIVIARAARNAVKA